MADALQFFINAKGRFVSGDHDKLRTTDHTGSQIDRAKHKYSFGIAFQKADLGPWMKEQLWPYLTTQWAGNNDALNRLNAWWGQPGLQAKHGGISMKITDGDKADSKGRVNDNTKGCFVFWLDTFGSGYEGEQQHYARPVTIYAGPSPDALVQIEHSQFKRGDYCTFNGTLRPNGKTGDQFGVYISCGMIWKLEDGPAIVGGADPSAAFKGAGLTGTFDPSGGAGAAFGGTSQPPVGNSAPGLGQTAPADSPAPGTTTSSAPDGTASLGNTTPHTDILNAGQPPAQGGAAPAPGAAPGLPGM